MNDERAAVLGDLVKLRRPVRDLAIELKDFDWDADFGLVQLTRSHAQSILKRYLKGELDAVECEDWAETVFGREDIALEAGHEVELKELLFWMAEPVINGPLTAELATAWVQRLRRSR